MNGDEYCLSRMGLGCLGVKVGEQAASIPFLCTWPRHRGLDVLFDLSLLLDFAVLGLIIGWSSSGPRTGRSHHPKPRRRTGQGKARSNPQAFHNACFLCGKTPVLLNGKISRANVEFFPIFEESAPTSQADNRTNPCAE
jgi:hypothetical protein